MKNLISNQLYITTFNYPMNSVKTLLFKNQTFDSLYKNKEFSIKMFIGSDWSIVGSGFSFFGPNDLKIVYIVSGIEIDDFETINKFSITYINSQKNEKNVAIVLNLISNTSNNSTVIEYRLEYENKSDFDLTPVYKNGKYDAYICNSKYGKFIVDHFSNNFDFTMYATDESIIDNVLKDIELKYE